MEFLRECREIPSPKMDEYDYIGLGLAARWRKMPYEQARKIITSVTEATWPEKTSSQVEYSSSPNDDYWVYLTFKTLRFILPLLW